MPSIDDIFGGNSLKAEHIKGKNPIVTISHVEAKEFEDKEKGGKQRKLVISFEKAERVLICNLTNANMIAELAGSRDYDKWAGTKLRLAVERVPFGSRIVDGIRVKDPNDKIESGPQKSVKEEMDDEIPF